MNKSFIVSSNFETWTSLNEVLAEPLDNGRKLYITVSDEPPRSGSANSLSHIYYRDIADFTGFSIDITKAACKIDYGLDILLAQSYEKTKAGSAAQGVFDALEIIKFRNKSREVQLKVIAAMQITSLLTKTNFNTYMQQMELSYRDQGLFLKSNREN